MDVKSRAQAIITKPKEEWIKIKDESLTVSQIFSPYVFILAAIPAVAQFIGLGLVGRRIPFIGWYRYGLGNALLYAILLYVLSLVSVYLFGIVINALAPSFGSKQNLPNAMKLAVFSMTPGWIAGVLYIIPMLGILVILANLYGIYVLYLGFNTPLMETPKDKVIIYLIVSIVVIVVLMIVVGVILGAIFTVGAVGRGVL